MTNEQFSGGEWDNLLDFSPPATPSKTAVMTQQDTSIAPTQLRSVQVDVPILHGRMPGKAHALTLDVKLAQLRKAPHTLRSQYNPNEDESLSRFAESLQSIGAPLYPLICLPTDDQVDIDGTLEDIFEVYDDVRVLYAHQVNRTPIVTILIPDRQSPGEALLKSLNLHAHYQPISLLEKADAARFLYEEYHYDQSVIAEHLGLSEENGEAPDQSYVSRLITIAKQPAVIRRFVHQGHLNMTHVRYLAERFPGRKEESQRILMARYVVQQNLSSKQMQVKISEMKGLAGSPPRMALIEGPDKIAEERHDLAISLIAEPKPLEALAYWQRPQRLVASIPRIKSEVKAYHVTVIPNADLAHVSMTLEPLDTLREWLDSLVDQRITQVEVAVVEAKLTGLLEATRQAMADANMLKMPDHGTVVDADKG